MELPIILAILMAWLSPNIVALISELRSPSERGVDGLYEASLLDLCRMGDLVDCVTESADIVIDLFQIGGPDILGLLESQEITGEKIVSLYWRCDDDLGKMLDALRRGTVYDESLPLV